MNRRKGRDANHDDDECTLNGSFSALAIADLHGDNDDEEEDYLTKSLRSIAPLDDSDKSHGLNSKQSNKPRRGKRPSKRASAAATAPTSWQRSSLTTGTKPTTGTTTTKKKSSAAGSLANLPKGSPKSTRKSYGGGSSGGSVSSVITAMKTKEQLVEEIPKHLQSKLYEITDPSLSIKERIEVEMKVLKSVSPEEKRIILKFKNSFDRKLFFDEKMKEEETTDEKIQRKIREGEKKEREIQSALEKERRKKKRMEELKLRREKQIEEDARRHAAKVRADDMAALKDAAYMATVTAPALRKEKEDEQKDLEDKVAKFVSSDEAKSMPDAQRELKIAMMEQKETHHRSSEKKTTTKKKTTSSLSNKSPPRDNNNNNNYEKVELEKKLKKVEKMLSKTTPGSTEYQKLQRKKAKYRNQLDRM
jgi:hypothetical protein